MGEQAVPGQLRDNSNAQPPAGVGARENILCETLVRGTAALAALEEALELGRSDGLVGLPPDRVLARRLLDEELVLRRAASVLAGLGGQRPGGDDHGLVASDRMLGEGGRAQAAPLGRGFTSGVAPCWVLG